MTVVGIVASVQLRLMSEWGPSGDLPLCYAAASPVENEDGPLFCKPF